MLFLIGYLALKDGIALGRIKQQDAAFARVKYLRDQPRQARNKIF
jgi:hypothetical protein